MRSWFARSIRRKLMLVVMATTLTALLVTAIATATYELRTHQQSWVDDLASQAEILGRASAPAIAFDDAKAASEDLALLRARPQILAAAIYTLDGTLFATYSRDAAAPLPPRPEFDGFRIQDGEVLLFQRIVEGQQTQATVYLRARFEPAERLWDHLRILGAIIVLSMLIAGLLSARLQRALTGPILAITEVAHKVMERRDFSRRVERTTDDEIGYLVDAFNAMLNEVGRRAEALEESNRSLQREMGERRGAEDALRTADRRKDEFLATLAHELRNPLAPMRNALHILRVAGDDPATAVQARAIIERQLQQMVRLVDDLLDVSRITTGKLVLRKERVDVGRIVQSAIETARPLIDERGQELAVMLPPAPLYIVADATRIAQVFSNLLNNAAKYTEPGGRISISAAVEHGEAAVRVADNGIGIAPGMRSEIFEMFAQVDRSLERTQAGLGVGLTLARHLIELHQGTIEAHSAGLGLGSEFVVRLPLVPERRALPREGASPAAGSVLSRLRVVVADDNDDFAASLAMILRSHGHEVSVATDGVEAVNLVRAMRCDVAFIDIGLPRLNGYDVARELRRSPETASTILVAVTGWGQESDRRAAREAGFDQHLVKPVEPAQIEALIASLCGEAAPPAPPGALAHGGSSAALL